MSLWESRAEEIQNFLDEGKDYGWIAKYYKVSRGRFRSELSTLCRKGIVRKPVKNHIHDSLPREQIDYKASIEIAQDGRYTSDKPLWMTLDQVKDPTYLLQAHGFEPDTWELVSAKNNIWNTNDKVHGIQTLYASKITVKPRDRGFSFAQLVEVIKAEIRPVHVESKLMRLHEERMLEIPVFDAHFGISTLEDYKPTQSKICDILTSRHWAETFFIVAQDMFHNDNFRGQTANGTQIEVVDIPSAWRDATAFYDPLITTAIRQSNRVFVMYSKANHDESLGWAFVQYLKAKYPQVEFDDAVQERKVHTFGKVFIGVTHGDKARKQLHNIFPVEFPHEWSQATTRELHCGHLHVEDAKDVFGMMVRTLATRNKTDQWHRDNGFVGAHKRFMLFEYSEEQLESIHYV